MSRELLIKNYSFDQNNVNMCLYALKIILKISFIFTCMLQLYVVFKWSQSYA